MNVLLLALSTIPNEKLNCFTYQYKNEDIFEGYYQLEPIPKFLNERLKLKDEKLDVVITLNTTEVNENKVLKVVGNNNGNEEFEFTNISAKDLFEKRLLMGDKKFEELPKIISIQIDVDDIIPGIISAVNELRKLKSCNTNFNLWMDMHGGPRNTQMTFQTILSLLKHESIQPSGVYTIIMNREKPNTIKDDTKYFDYIDFVSGMNEFINFGKPISMKYVSDLNDKSLIEFSRKANDVMDALSLCDMSKFQSAIAEMSNWLNKHDIKKDSLLELFIKNIQIDYGVLLKENHDVLDEIEWCLKKGYLQQALTLIESKMPEELFEKHIISYSESDMEYNGNSIKFKQALKMAKQKVKRVWESDRNFIFIKWIQSLEVLDLNKYQHEIPMKLNKNRDQYLDFELKWEPNFGGVPIDLDKKNKVILEIKIKDEIFKNDSLKDMLMRYVILHFALKKERNTINHALDKERTSTKDIREAIGGYIDLARILYKA